MPTRNVALEMQRGMKKFYNVEKAIASKGGYLAQQQQFVPSEERLRRHFLRRRPCLVARMPGHAEPRIV